VFAQDAQIQAPAQPAPSSNAAKVQNLQRVIDAQQKQLDTQQEQLEAQKKQLQELRRQVQALAKEQETSRTPVVEQTTPVPPGGVTSRRTDIHTARRDKGQPHEEWQGSFGVEDLNTRFKIGGFAELDVIHDSDAIGTPGEFVTSAIVTRDATKVEGADGQTNFSVNPTRLYAETRTPIEQHKLTTFLSMDFFDDSTSTTPDPRLRQAYGEVTNILFGGDLLAGQAWTTFSDLEAFPNTLDFQGPNSFFGVPASRWCAGPGGSPTDSN
jgi:hypothetical protein